MIALNAILISKEDTMGEEERSAVKRTLLDLIGEVRTISGFSGTVVNKLDAVSAAERALACLCDGAAYRDAATIAAGEFDKREVGR